MVRTNKKSVFFHNSDLFRLQIKPRQNSTAIQMQLYTAIVNTRYLPQTYSIIKEYLPSVLATICYNELHLPFHKEVKATEIGHLFEHILLENLCIEKIDNGFKTAEYNGNTKWNWVTGQYGSFNIVIDASFTDLAFTIKALKRTIKLTESILRSETVAQPLAVKSGEFVSSESGIWLHYNEDNTSR